jgi:simple sugar transport system ATP-binding protein
MPAEQSTTTGNPAGGTIPPPPAIRLKHISKSFGAVRANRDVSLEVAKGSIHGIVGENGAGKSTLMSILYGFYEADSGEIEIAGRPARIRNSQEAIGLGIGMVHQHFMLVDTFTVLENVILGAESGALLAPSKDQAARELARLENEYNLYVAPEALVGDLLVGERQRVEILKALYRGAEILILDEPTGVLTPQETDQLFRILRALRDQGVTVILITHKLREIMDVTDAVSVMRGGQMVAHRKTADTDKEELAELMVGRKVRLELDKEPASPGPTRLLAENVTVTDADGVPRLDNVSLTVHAGEIVGIAGVSGNGQSELLEVLSGIAKPSQGRLVLNGREVTAQAPVHPDEARKLGIAHVPEDRHRLGLVTSFSARESAILGYQGAARFNRGPILDGTAITQNCSSLMEQFDVRPPDPWLRSGGFSGGNQQKLILAREMSPHPEVLLVGQPTRGVDIGAIEFIHRQLVARRDAGCAVLLVSVELDEILALSDRILVMFEGRIVGELTGAEADERRIGLMMANAMDSSEHATAGSTMTEQAP